MASLAEATLKGNATIQFIKANTGAGLSNPPQTIKFEFNVKKRVENQVISIANNASYTVTIADENLTGTNIIRILCLTAGKKFVLKLNGELTGVEYIPATSNDHAFYFSTANLTSFEIENPTANATSIDLEYSMAQYAIPS